LSRRLLFLALLLISYFAVLIPFTGYLKNRPIAVKLGYVPSAEIVKPLAGDQRYLIAESYILRVLFYYGSLVDKLQNRINIPPEYYNMYKTLEAAVQLDPYNMDAYYFTQAAFTWELNQAKAVNEMLKYGMRYRTWDFWLPYYIGFNAAYFLHDYKTGALYMKRAAQLSENSLLITLASRYFYEAGENDLAIIFLDGMIKNARNDKIRKVFELRKNALLAAEELEKAVVEYKRIHGTRPRNLTDLVAYGILKKLPEDPYGGSFYLDPHGKVRSTSKFAQMEKKGERH
jgi:hypothetical protein